MAEFIIGGLDSGHYYSPAIPAISPGRDRFDLLVSLNYKQYNEEINDKIWK